ncbi:FHA domain protein [Symmachiella dynata]|uniref:FHA domain-containing protein n=1 Tax=Symmachiella dynata TaxID=2527995 RepID=UPI00118ABD8D|nr:FHA domain-containing protein [Symmachiella dynata]QDT48558.1 FHA domain protein [Symmachiella dynata]
MQAEMKVIGGKQQGKVIPLTMKKFLIGREKDCHLRPNNDLISRHHCVLTVDEYTVRIRDLGSTNGTYVNSERIQGQVVLKDGDKLAIGKLLFEVSVRDVDAPAVSNEDVLEDAALLETDAFTSGDTPPPASRPAETPAQDDSVLAQETITLPAMNEDTAYETPSAVYGDDTVSIPPSGGGGGSENAPPPEAPPAPAPQYQQPMMMPQYQQPMMPQQYPMQYPQQMPMMPQQYGQQMPMMPQQYPPQYPQPVQMAPQQYPPQEMAPPPSAEPPAAEKKPAIDEMDVRLPNPEETGAVEPASAKPEAKPGEASTEIDPRTAAADIIRQYTHRPLGQ